MSMNFSEEITDFKKALKEKQKNLEKLKARRDAHAVQTRRARAALEDLRAVLRGETPPSQQSSSRSSEGISAVPVDKETNRPARGARRKQIEMICRKIGSTGDIFRTADVLNTLREVEDEVSSGMRSYTYTVMNGLEEEGLVERQGRGKWIWKG